MILGPFEKITFLGPDPLLSELSEEEKKTKINEYPPYAIQWEKGGMMTSDVGGIKKRVRKVDPGFYN
jgi:hypothetical protein